VPEQPPHTPPRAPGFDEEGDATRRTWLANERTMLAWLRTGLAALAVAVAVGKIVPDLRPHTTRWPWAVLGAGYGLLGIALIVYGMQRRATVDRAIRAGRYEPAADTALGVIGAFALVLAVFTVIVVVTSS
jgi:putative membrane protein